jgi:nitrite reductase/ring-hydroxylating ferredoxin subunit
MSNTPSSARHEVARIDDIADPGSREFVFAAGNRLVRAFVVRSGTRIHAYLNCCPHAGQPLNRSPDGFLSADNRLIMCRAHGAMFAIDSGVCVEGICLGESLQRLSAQVVDGMIVVNGEIAIEQQR